MHIDVDFVFQSSEYQLRVHDTAESFYPYSYVFRSTVSLYRLCQCNFPITTMLMRHGTTQYRTLNKIMSINTFVLCLFYFNVEVPLTNHTYKQTSSTYIRLPREKNGYVQSHKTLKTWMYILIKRNIVTFNIDVH